MAQSGSAPVWGTGGRGFKSRRPDRWTHLEDRTPASRRVLTVPNLISALRIATIPVFWALIVDADTSAWGIALFALVVATDWVDGTIARRTGQVSELGKVLDPGRRPRWRSRPD